MSISGFGRRPLCITSSTLFTALLCACATHGSGGTLPGLTAPGDVSPPKNTQTFKYTGHRQTFEVPAGVTAIRIVADGASGSGSTGGYGSESAGGAGGSVKATIPVTFGERTRGLRRRRGCNFGRIQRGRQERRQHHGERQEMAEAEAAPRMCGRAVVDWRSESRRRRRRRRGRRWSQCFLRHGGGGMPGGEVPGGAGGGDCYRDGPDGCGGGGGSQSTGGSGRRAGGQSL